MFGRINKKNVLHVAVMMDVFRSLFYNLSSNLFIFPCIFPSFSVQRKLAKWFSLTKLAPSSPFLFPYPFPSPVLFFFSLPPATKNMETSELVLVLNGSFVFSQPEPRNSSNVVLFYVTTEVAAAR